MLGSAPVTLRWDDIDLGGFQIQNEFKLGRLFNRQVWRGSPFGQFVHVFGGAREQTRYTGPV
jgi:hypothetical protein